MASISRRESRNLFFIFVVIPVAVVELFVFAVALGAHLSAKNILLVVSVTVVVCFIFAGILWLVIVKLVAPKILNKQMDFMRTHPPDFEVNYKVLSPKEGGISSRNFVQGLRTSWLYEGDDTNYRASKIWPEFEDAVGEPLPMWVQIPSRGKAKMYIMFEEVSNRRAHQKRIKIGTKGYLTLFRRFHNTKVAEAEVTKIIGLKEDYTLRIA